MSSGRRSEGTSESAILAAGREAPPVCVNLEPGPPRPSLGSLLVQAGVASEQQLKFAVAEGLETGEKLGEVLVRRGWATDESLARVLADQWQLAFTSSEELVVDPSAVELMPRADARELGALPIGFEGDRVVVAISEPTQDLLDALAQRFEHPACVVITRSELHALLDELSYLGQTEHDAEPGEAEGEAGATAVIAPPARAGHDPAAAGGSAKHPHELAPVGADTLVERSLSSLAASMNELARIHRDVAALGTSLQLAREQLSEANAELEAAEETHEQDAATIDRLESERSAQAELFETLRTQVANLTATLAAHTES